MTDLPENVDLQWVGRTLLSMRDDMAVMAAILRRLDNAQTDFRDEMRALFDIHRHLRGRVDARPVCWAY
jgi:hypothetical protein